MTINANSVRNQLQKVALERLCSAYSDNQVIIRTQCVDTPLCSASLLANLSKHELVRNMEGGDNLSVIRKILSIVDPQHSMWRFEHQQDHRVQQYRQGIVRIDRRLRAIDLISSSSSDCNERDKARYEEEREKLLKQRQQYLLVIDNCRPVVKGTLHPNGVALSSQTPSTTPSPSPSSSTNTHSSAVHEKMFDGWRVRGIYARLAGPKKATKAGQWRRSAGAYSLNSYAFVDGEHHNVQIPSRTGTYGLTVQVVWALQKEARCGLRSVYSDGVEEYVIADAHRRLV